MKVAILGAGPAGLFAAHAAVTGGHDVAVFSKAGRRSFMNGAQYLHRRIPGLQPKMPFRISYELVGDANTYRKKVYGDTLLAGESSADTLVGNSPAWDVRVAYDHAWALYGPDVVEWEAGRDPLPIADLVISTIPRNLLCGFPDKHVFLSQDVWATDRVVYPAALPDECDNVVLLSGKTVDNWYRQSRIRGHENTEWPLKTFASPERFDGKLWRVVKPIATDCTCHPNIKYLGRYGEWKKGVLAHDGYYKTVDLLKAAR